MRRRDFIKVFGGVAVLFSPAARGQQTGKMPRIGVLWHAASAEEEGPYLRALLEGLRVLGHVDGRSIALEHRFPNEMPERFRSMAAELVSSKVDVLVSVGSLASMAARNATTAIPVIFVLAPDPVGTKLVDSLARPGGNATGLASFAVDLSGKRLQFLKEAIPGLSRVALLVNPNNPISRRYIEEAKSAAPGLRLDVQVFEAHSLDELERAFDAMARGRIQALTINPDGSFFQKRETIVKLALTRRLPACVPAREFLKAGALMSYGPDQKAIFRRAAVYVDKILKGAKPADLPVEQPTRLEFLINLKTAGALGMKVPQSLLLQADEVIQ